MELVSGCGDLIWCCVHNEVPSKIQILLALFVNEISAKNVAISYKQIVQSIQSFYYQYPETQQK